MQPKAELLPCLPQHRQQQITPHPTGDHKGPAVAAQGDVGTAAIGKLPRCPAHLLVSNPKLSVQRLAKLRHGWSAAPRRSVLCGRFFANHSSPHCDAVTGCCRWRQPARLCLRWPCCRSPPAKAHSLKLPGLLGECDHHLITRNHRPPERPHTPQPQPPAAGALPRGGVSDQPERCPPNPTPTPSSRRPAAGRRQRPTRALPPQLDPTTPSSRRPAAGRRHRPTRALPPNLTPSPPLPSPCGGAA